VADGSAALIFRDEHRLRPPRAELSFDLALTNRADAARWAIMRDTLGGGRIPLTTSVWSVGGYVLGEARRVVAVHAVAENGWYAVLVPGRGTVRLERVPFAFWGETPASAELDVEMATEVALDGSPLLARLDLDARSDDGAVADGRPLGSERAVAAAVSGGPAAPLAARWSAAEVLRASAVVDP
jgi:hypothetical protein